MTHRLTAFAALAAVAVGASAGTAPAHANPFLTEYNTPYQIPPFGSIEYSDYMPALRAGIAQKQQQIRDITSNPETPTFDNTIMPLERSGEIIDRVAAVFLSLIHI